MAKKEKEKVFNGPACWAGLPLELGFAILRYFAVWWDEFNSIIENNVPNLVRMCLGMVIIN